IFSDVCSVFHERLLKNPASITASVVERMRHGLEVTGVEYAEAQAFRTRFRMVLRQVFAQVDMILSPTAPHAAPPIEDGANLLDATKASTRNTYIGGAAAIPGLSLPCGMAPEGVPIGLMLEAAWWQEPMLFQAGVAFQQRTDFHRQRAPMVAG
ncbi:MAG: hypothetical protein DI537_54195, partial [Stutzerimonas stutzeri]